MRGVDSLLNFLWIIAFLCVLAWEAVKIFAIIFGVLGLLFLVYKLIVKFTDKNKTVISITYS